jgi:hypothetical protein
LVCIIQLRLKNPIFRIGLLSTAECLVVWSLCQKTIYEKTITDGKPLQARLKSNGELKITKNESMPAYHTLIVGDTQVGKSTVIKNMIDNLDRVIALDVRCDLTQRYSGLNMNPFDERYVNWDPFIDITGEISEAQLPQLARWIVPREVQKENPFWNNASRQILEATIRYGALKGCLSAKWLRQILNQRDTKERLKELLEVIEPRLVDTIRGDNVTTQGILGNFNTHTEIFRWLGIERGEKKWSLKQWIENGSGIILLPFAGEQTAGLKKVYGLFFNMLVNYIISDTKPIKPIKIFLDEFADLQAIEGLMDGFQKGLLRGVTIILGTQTILQVSNIYGRDRGQTLLGQCANVIAFRCSDKDTAEEMSRRLGAYNEKGTDVSHSKSSEGKVSESTREEKKEKSTVPSLKIRNLGDHHFYGKSKIDATAGPLKTTLPKRVTEYEAYIPREIFKIKNLTLIEPSNGNGEFKKTRSLFRALGKRTNRRLTPRSVRSVVEEIKPTGAKEPI